MSLPQAFRLVLPSWSNGFILMLKYSSIVFTVTLLALMGQGKRLALRSFKFFEVFIVVALFVSPSCSSCHRSFG